MSQKHKTITSLDDRVARMSDLRTLVDTIAEMIAGLDHRLSAAEAELGLNQPVTASVSIGLVPDAEVPENAGEYPDVSGTTASAPVTLAVSHA